MDNRAALKQNYRLKLAGQEGSVQAYTIGKEAGRGASSIVYEAFYRDNLGNAKPVLIKECCPYALTVERQPDGALSAENQLAFEEEKKRMVDAYRHNHALFQMDELANALANLSDIYECNNTIYIVSAWQEGCRLSEYKAASLKEFLQLLISCARILGRIHEAGYLYLDLKPDNILVLTGLPGMVRLFDFDSLVSRKDLSDAEARTDVRIRQTYGYAPLEQQTGDAGKLGPWSDIFSLGAILFEGLFGRLPDAFDCSPMARFDFSKMRFSGTYMDKLYRELTSFLHHTLASYCPDRYQSAQEAAGRLSSLLDCADLAAEFIISSALSRQVYFTGREGELSAIHQLLAEPENKVVNICGIGGIGKSSLIREYLYRHRDEYDSILYLPAPVRKANLLADDLAVAVNTVTREPGEAEADYLDRKKRAIRRITAKQKVIVVIDNAKPAAPEVWEDFLDTGVQLVILSREKLPDGYCPELKISELDDSSQRRLFGWYSHREQWDEASGSAFRKIADRIYGHTLTLELIARQIAGRKLTLAGAAKIVSELGYRNLPEDELPYIRDQRLSYQPLLAIIGKLFGLERFSSQQKTVLKLLSLFDEPGISEDLFLQIAGIADGGRELRQLADSGWLRQIDGVLSYHPLIQEYFAGWPWEDYAAETEALMYNLDGLIRPEDAGNGRGKQFPADYRKLQTQLNAAEQAARNYPANTPAKERLLYHLAIDAPVDEEEKMVERIACLTEHTQFLEPDCILRLYGQQALLLGRLRRWDEAFDAIGKMKDYLDHHPSDYYESLYHQDAAVLLHNAEEDGTFEECLVHEEMAVECARRSGRPEAKKQLATSLLTQAITLLRAEIELEKVAENLREAKLLVEETAGEYDYVRYQLYTTMAMFYARVFCDREESLHYLALATKIADEDRDSALSYGEHLVEQAAYIYLELGMNDKAEEALREALSLYEGRRDMPVYDDAWNFASNFLKSLEW